MAFREQVARHRAAHRAQSNESYDHGASPGG
jgi:hypothetical protein